MPTEPQSQPVAAFQLLERLDETSTAESWRAIQTALERPVVIRIMKPEAAADAARREAFLSVARLFAKAKCENIISVFDIAETDSRPYAVLEQLEGETLAQLLKRTGPLPLDQILPIAAAAVNALSVLWGRFRLVSRDVTPASLQFDGRGVVKLNDFSLAVTPEHAGEDEIVGQPCYLAPEQIQGLAPLSDKSDMYALGALLYELATGLAPFAEADPMATLRRQVSDRLAPPDGLVKGLPPDFSRFLGRLMMKAPADRYPDWDAVQTDLGALTAGVPVTPLPAGQPDSSIDLARIHIAPSAPSSASVDRLQREHSADVSRSGMFAAIGAYGLMGIWFLILFGARAVWPEWRAVNSLPELPPVKIPSLPPSPAVRPRPAEPAPVPPPRAEAAPVVPVAAVRLPAPPPEALAAALGEGSLARARAAVAAAGDFKDKAAILDLLKRAPLPDALVAEGLKPLVGREISLPVMGKVRRCTPRAVYANAFEVDCNGRTIRIPFDKFGPDDALRIAVKPHDDATALAYCLLVLRSSDHAALAEAAKGCPLLAGELLRASRP